MRSIRKPAFVFAFLALAAASLGTDAFAAPARRSMGLTEKDVIEYVRRNSKSSELWGDGCGTNAGNQIFWLDRAGAQLAARLLNALSAVNESDLLKAQLQLAMVLKTEEEPQISLLAFDRSKKRVVKTHMLSLVGLLEEDESKVIARLPVAKVDGYYDGFRAIYEILKTSRHLVDAADSCAEQDWSIENFRTEN